MKRVHEAQTHVKSCKIRGGLSNWNYLITDKDNRLTEPMFHSTDPRAVGRRYFLLLVPGWCVLDRERKEYIPYGVAIGFVRAHSNAFGYAKKTMKPENPRNYNMCDNSDTASVRIERSEIDEDIANPEVCVSGGIPLSSEYDGQVSLVLPVGLLGQHALYPKSATLPRAAA